MQFKHAKHLALAILASTALAGAAQAQTVITPTDPCDWTGPYIGLNFGELWNHYDVSSYRDTLQFEAAGIAGSRPEGIPEETINFPFPGHSSDQNNFTGGGQAGYLWQFGHFVFGVEGDINGSSNESNEAFRGFFNFDDGGVVTRPKGENFFDGVRFNSDRDIETFWFGSARGVLGYAWGPWLFYITGGAAFIDAEMDSFDSANFFLGDGANAQPRQQLNSSSVKVSGTDENVLVGWTVGTGFQFAFNKVMSMGVEYSHSDYGDDNFNFHHHGLLLEGGNNVDLDSDLVVFKVNLLLGHIH